MGGIYWAWGVYGQTPGRWPNSFYWAGLMARQGAEAAVNDEERGISHHAPDQPQKSDQ